VTVYIFPDPPAALAVLEMYTVTPSPARLLRCFGASGETSFDLRARSPADKVSPEAPKHRRISTWPGCRELPKAPRPASRLLRSLTGDTSSCYVLIAGPARFFELSPAVGGMTGEAEDRKNAQALPQTWSVFRGSKAPVASTSSTSPDSGQVRNARVMSTSSTSSEYGQRIDPCGAPRQRHHGGRARHQAPPPFSLHLRPSRC